MSVKLIIRNHLSPRHTVDYHISLGELRELLKLLEQQNTTDRLEPGKYTIKGPIIVLNVTIDDDYDIIIENK